MKKQLTAMLFIFALLLTMAGCSAANAVQKLDTVEDRIEAKVDAAEDKLEDSLREAVSPAPTVTPTFPSSALAEEVPASTEAAHVPAEAPPAATESIRKLTEEQALQVALDYLGFSADQVTRLNIAYEIDDKIPQFDVEFSQGDWEYEFEIHAENGRIISYDKDHKYD